MGKLPVHDEILNKNACENIASMFSIIKNEIFLPPTCVEVPHSANLVIDGIISCPRPQPCFSEFCMCTDLELVRLDSGYGHGYVRLCQYLLLNYSQTFIICGTRLSAVFEIKT